MEVAKAKGLMRPNSINDAPKHYSDPPYTVIKPGYRAHEPLPNFNQLQMKERYSFSAFGAPKISR
jgi:hypothetical protein